MTAAKRSQALLTLTLFLSSLSVVLPLSGQTAPAQAKSYALSTWSNITCRAKGRFQDRDYCASAVMDQIVADGKSAIPVLISQITDSRWIAEPVYDYWPRIRAGELAYFILSDLFLDDTWEKSTMPALFPHQVCNKDDPSWVHSKHVIHVFPRDAKLLISEWARVIRVAHSVRKTFILAIPGKSRAKRLAIDFVLYHRKGNGIETPADSKPRFGMLSLSEEEYIGGSELSAIINEAKEQKLELIIAIADRETAVTYYKVKRIELEGSSYEYYEIDWLQP